jgi:hypothetical protein
MEVESLFASEEKRAMPAFFASSATKSEAFSIRLVWEKWPLMEPKSAVLNIFQNVQLEAN